VPTFKYAAVTVAGEVVSGAVRGASVEGVAASLVDRGLAVRRVRQRRSLLKFEITKAKIKPVEVMHFSRQLAAFIRAGVPITEAIELLSEEVSDKVLRPVLADVGEALLRGESISAAIAPHADAFPRFYVSVLRSVELTGELDRVLEQLADYVERDLEARRKLKSALAYPSMVMGMSVVTVVVLAGFVLPRFKAFFAGLNAKLPLPTRILLAVTDFISAWWWAILVVFALAVVSGVLSVRTSRGRHIRDRYLLKVPVLGDVVQYAVVERFCRILCSMVEAGVPLPDALKLASDGTQNIVYERALATAHEAMIEGEGLAAPIAATGLFPGSVTRMFRVGENTGTLDSQLASMASYYEKELEYKLKNLTTLFEPIAIVTMGLVVGFVAVALVSAMYGVFNQVQV
jgi:type IV pilus assembly protein PilC